MNRERIMQALKNCIEIPSCRDCPWEACEYEHEIREVPLSLLQAALEVIELDSRLEDDLK